MDARQFDALARQVSSRRTALGGLLAGLLLPLEAVARGKQGKGNTKDRHKGRGKGKNTRRKEKKGANAQASQCWRAGACMPKKGANVSQCDLAGYTAPADLNCTGCNLSRANLRGAKLQGTNFTKANLSGACLIDADFTGATFANNTNLANALFCNTKMPDGWINNSGCQSSTACCPICDDQHSCGNGLVCCDGRCITGDCCDVCPSGCPFTTLAAAIAGTPAGGTIQICPGTYPTKNLSIQKNLTIIGAGAGSDPATHSILSGEKTSRVLEVAFATVTFQDLTVTDGKGTDQCGGITVFFDATVNLERVEIVGNSSDVGPTGFTAGGGLSVYQGSTAVVKASSIAANTTQGGPAAGGGGIYNAGTLSLEATRVERNSAPGGAGIFNSGSLTLNPAAIITLNTATDPTPSGGGIYNRGTIIDNDAANNVTGNSPDNCISEAPGTSCPT